MKLFKNFIIPFILAIIVFSPRFVSAAELSFTTPNSESVFNSIPFVSPDSIPADLKYYYEESLKLEGFTPLVVYKNGSVSACVSIATSSDFSLAVYNNGSYWIGTYKPNSSESVNNYVYNKLYVIGNANVTDGFRNTVSSIPFNSSYFVYGFTPPPPEYDYNGKNPLDLDIDGFMEWIENNPEFAQIIKNNAPYLRLDTLGKLKFLMQYYDDYGKYENSFAYNFLTGLSDILDVTEDTPLFPEDIPILRNVLKMQYNKYINSKTPPVILPTNSPYIPSDNPVVVPSGTPSGTIVIENNNDANYYYLREIIRLLNVDINNNNSFQYTNSIFFNSIIDSLNDVLNDLYLLLAPVNSITDKLVELNNNLLNIIPSGSCNYDESFWEYMLTPTYSGFDDLQQICVDKFPVLDQITEVPDPDQLLLTSSQTISLADSSSDSSVASSETFSFTAPASFANGAFSNIEIPIIDFSRFSLAISAFKGIISVFALSIFSKWLIKFAPKLLNGYSSSD